MYQDEQLICKDCKKSFTFTAGEQAFYKEHDFEHKPQRCETCREVIKEAKKAKKAIRVATCMACGNKAYLPFEPQQGKPVYCSKCFEELKNSGLLE